MRVFIAILGWAGGAVNGDHQTLRDTWLKKVPQFSNLEYRIFIGDGTPTDEDETKLFQSLKDCHHPTALGTSQKLRPEFIQQADEVLLHVPDDYEHLTYKTREALRWAVLRGYDYIFTCFPDTYVDISRLMISGFDSGDYTGKSIGYAKGGQGRWLSNRAARLVVNEPVTDWAEDRWVGNILRKHGIVVKHDARYADYPEYPTSQNTVITSHLAEARPYDSRLMTQIFGVETPDTRDAVISATKGYDWPQLRAYANSLVQCGFRGRKIFFVDGITSLARTELTRLGFQLIDFQAESSRPFVSSRIRPVTKFLREHSSEFRYVVWADCRDLVFQSNPSFWLEKNLAPHRILGASECTLIKNEPTNDQWVKESLPQEHSWVREHDVLCGGTLAGDVETITNFFSQMQKLLDTRSGVDQPLINYLFRVPPFVDIGRVPKMKDGWAATSGWCLAGRERWVRTDEPPVLDKKSGTVFTPDGKTPFVVFHQYDRNNEWQRIIDRKYMGEIFPPAQTVRSKEVKSKSRYASDGLTIDWFDQH